MAKLTVSEMCNCKRGACGLQVDGHTMPDGEYKVSLWRVIL